MALFAKETLQLSVTGMTCGNCVAHVTKALQGVEGVKKVDVDLAGGQATVIAKPGAPRAAMVAAVKAAGYDAS